MTGGRIVRTSEGSRPALRVSGCFDRECAWALRERLEDELDVPEIALDFGEVTDFSDMAVALLANGLVRLRARVRVTGLGPRQLRILRYCEVPLTGGEEPARGAAGEQRADL